MKTILKIVIAALLITISYISFAQGVSKVDKIKYGKKFALDYCIYNNYKSLDSNYALKFRDASGLLFSINGGFTQKIQDQIIEYTIKKTSKFFTSSPPLQYRYKNLVVCDCLYFYESKALKEYLNGIFNKKQLQ